MNKAAKITFGLALVAAGIIWILCILDIITLDFSLKGWWALFIILPCLFNLFVDKDKVGSCVGIGVGVLLMLAARDVITWNMFWQLCLALLAIAFGINLILFKGCRKRSACEMKTISREGKEIRRIETSFGKQSISFDGEVFEGADVKTSFGALTLDLRNAEIVDGAFLNIEVGFGGLEILAPEGIAVKTAVEAGFGGVKDSRKSCCQEAATTLNITGKVGFAGVEIK